MGYSHHRWVVGVNDNKLEFAYKQPYVHWDLDYKIPIAEQILNIYWTDSLDAVEIMYHGNDTRKEFVDFCVNRWGRD